MIQTFPSQGENAGACLAWSYVWALPAQTQENLRIQVYKTSQHRYWWTIGTPRVQILKKNCLTFSYIIPTAQFRLENALLILGIYQILWVHASTINYCTKILNLLKHFSCAQDTENAEMEGLFLRPVFKTVIQDLFMSISMTLSNLFMPKSMKIVLSHEIVNKNTTHVPKYI